MKSDALNPDRYRNASDHELEVVAPQAATRLQVDTAAIGRLNMAANSMPVSVAASPSEHVGGVVAANVVVPAETVVQRLQEQEPEDSIVNEEPRLEHTRFVDRRDADAFAARAAREAEALQAVEDARLRGSGTADVVQLDDFRRRREAGFGNVSAHISYIGDLEGDGGLNEGSIENPQAVEAARSEVVAALERRAA